MDGRLRVLMVVDDLRIGGAQRQVVGLAAALAESGHTVVVACTEGGPVGAGLGAAGVPVRMLGRRRVAKRVSLATAVRIARLVRAERFDVVHAHVHAASMAAAVAASFMRAPVVVTEHSMASWRGRLARAYSRLLYRRCAMVLAVSAEIQDRLYRSDRVPAGRVRVVGTALFGRQTGAVRSARTRPAEPRERPLHVGVVARLEREKGVELFVRAAARVAAVRPDAAFSVVGDGSLRPDLEALADGLGLGGRLAFAGERADGEAAVAELDVLCLPSVTEGAPLVVLEAMAAGVPVVATRVGGVPAQLDGGQAGVLVEPGDADALSDALVRLIDEPRERDRLARAGLARHAELGGGPTVVAAVEAAYRDALDDARDPGDRD
ncbi:glycosyltransferase [Yinghuangia soli]|uniref:Glycosyltransferase n=1 Tax=Yinghuangia soli TaxID=2908204 RepID=A0AA41Q2M8_9ACTN|nr:glycosyltransferase [Yinghuangia soli]MCF2530186.1 glycosyltransferase [Yinghuangia soli]